MHSPVHFENENNDIQRWKSKQFDSFRFNGGKAPIFFFLSGGGVKSRLGARENYDHRKRFTAPVSF